jgi:transposase-like protein
MSISQIQVTRIHCPNCGNCHCERINVLDRSIQRIECINCDYLLITCTRTHQVIEAYAPGIRANFNFQ